jgi:hypothetical protein
MKEEGSCSVNAKDHPRWVEVEWAVALEECFEPAEAVEDDAESKFENEQAAPC